MTSHSPASLCGVGECVLLTQSTRSDMLTREENHVETKERGMLEV